MTVKGKLVLANGTVFEGTLLTDAATVGEVVFNTGMTGYQEVLTDPSYADQIVTLTYPLVGNYGVYAPIEQSKTIHCRGFIVGELCGHPSNWQSEGSFGAYLNAHRIPCLFDVDTRAITRAIRNEGVMKGVIVPASYAQERIDALLAEELPTDQVKRATVSAVVMRGDESAKYHVVVYDFGAKENILKGLEDAGCRLTIVPADTAAEAALGYNPDGIFLSNGPGDPKDLDYAVTEIRKLLDKKPIFGICMGHQLVARALGGDTYKLRFGHRGSNHPVKDLATGRVYITSQNHGYAVDERSLADADVRISHVSVNDGTVEGLRHNSLPVMTVQYHPEASPGPTDNLYLFDEFIALMGGK